MKISKAADLKTGQVMLSGTKTVSRTTIFGFCGLCLNKVASASSQTESESLSLQEVPTAVVTQRYRPKGQRSKVQYDELRAPLRDWRPFPGVFPTRRRSGGGRG